LAIVQGLLTARPILARVPLAGGVPRQVLEGVGYANADWAPNGKQLAVVRSVEGRDRLEFPIGKVLLEANGISSPRFSPRGDSIAFFERESSSSVSVIGSSGKGKKTLSSGWAPFSGGVPCWTPDGQEVWFTASEPGKPDALYAVNQSGKRRLVMRVPGHLELDDISRDGRVLIAHHTVLRAVKGLFLGESGERDLSWLDFSLPSDLSSDGRTLLLTERGEGSGPAPSVYLRKTDGSPAVRLGEGLGIALSPDGKWVLASIERRGSAPPHLALLPTGAGETKALKNHRFERFGWGSFSADGKGTIFSATERGHRSRIYVQDLDEGKARPISPEGVSIPRFTSPLSPDGRFVFGIHDSGRASLYPLKGEGARPIAGLAAEDQLIRWSADGRSLFVLRREPQFWRVWLFDPETGSKQLWKEIKPAEPATMLNLLLTQDGKSYVYGYRRAISELYLVEGLK